MHAFSLLLLTSAQPAEAPVEIVVTGHELQQALGSEAYGSVTIDREQLLQSPSNRLEEILKSVAGFQLFRRSDAASANPTSQGATLRALGGNASSRLLLILDGVPQSDPFGGWISWPAFDPRRLGKVQVIRGGGAGAYGPGALAGTIELQSATPADLKGLQAEASYGSRSSVDAYAGYGFALGDIAFNLSALHAQGDGFIPIVADQRGPVDRPAPYRQSSASLRALMPIADGVELQANGLHFDDERERGVPFTDNETTGTDGSVRLLGPRWSLLGYAQFRDYYNSFASINATRTAAAQVAEQYSVPSSGYGARGEWRPRMPRGIEVRLGADGRLTTGETNEFYSFQNGNPTRERQAGGRAATLGGFTETAWTTGALVLTGGARIDRWWIDGGFLEERVLATDAVLTDSQFDSRSGWEPTARAGVTAQMGPGMKVRAAAYRGWRLPTLNELYRPFRVGPDATAANAELTPERLTGLEAGFEYNPLPPLKLSATLFVNRLNNAIANVNLGSGPGVFSGVGFVAGQYNRRQNLDTVVSKGLELDARLPLGQWLVTGSYSFVDAEVEASGAAEALNGLRPAQTPRHSLSASAGWQGETGARAAVLLHYSGSRFEDDLNQDLLPSALTFDLTGAVPLRKGLSLEMRAENISGERVVAGISNGLVERATPRTLWIGLSWRD